MSEHASQNGIKGSLRQFGETRPLKNSTSGYRGVSWHKGARKWGAYIRRRGVRRFLGLFETAEAAHAAYLEADAHLHVEPPDPRAAVLTVVRALYDEHGPRALATPFLIDAGIRPDRLRKAGLKHADLLRELGLADEYECWRKSSFTYAGKVKTRWSWDEAIKVAAALRDQEGDLPTVQWCRLNGHSQLTNVVHTSGRTWEDLRAAIGLPPSGKFYNSRVGMRWRSRPEASLSNFLYARGVEHKRGERYPEEYSKQSGRAYGRYDLHFRSASGDWIDVEVWGDIPDAYSHGRYRRTRAHKEAWRANDPHFLGLQYKDCLSDVRLGLLLEPYIGGIQPFRFDKPQDRQIETAHWSDADEFLETCRQLAAQMPDGLFPSEDWLRRRGKYAARPGEPYNTIAVRVNQWLGGTRRVRQLLGQAEASTTVWTPESAIAAWQAFQQRHELSPSQLKSNGRRGHHEPPVVREAERIYAACDRLGVLSEARRGMSARVKWTAERAIADWREFSRKHGLSPSQAMSAWRREILPPGVYAHATRIYSAARNLGVLEAARSSCFE